MMYLGAKEANMKYLSIFQIPFTLKKIWAAGFAALAHQNLLGCEERILAQDSEDMESSPYLEKVTIIWHWYVT